MVEEKKILIVRLSSFGDIILTFPLINLLKRKFPASHITFVVKERYETLLRMNPLIDEIICLKEGVVSETKDKVSSKKYDLVIDLQNNPKSRYLTSGFSNVKRFRKNNLKKFLLVKFKINLFKESEPVYQRYIRATEDILSLSENDLTFTTSLLNADDYVSLEGNYILIAPSSRHFTKTYPKEKFVEFINRNPGKRYVLAGDSSETDMEICKYIHGKTSNTINLCGELNFEQLTEVISKAEHVICNDSGVLHLSEALGKKVTAVFGSTVKEFGFFPQQSGSKVIENVGLKCRPCSHIGLPYCPLKHFKCMNDIDISDA